MDINSLRKYRIQLNPYDNGFFYNDVNYGISLFDLLSAFLGAYLLDYFFKFSNYFKNKQVYYLSVIPFGILFHYAYNTPTFLNKQLFSTSFNIYKLILLIILYKILF